MRNTRAGKAIFLVLVTAQDMDEYCDFGKKGKDRNDDVDENIER